MTVQRRKLRFDTWEEVTAELDRLLASGYGHASHGRLSLGQISVHLAKVLDATMDGFPYLLPLPIRMVLRLWLLPRMLRHQPLSFKATAPAALAPPATCNDEQGVTELKAAIARFDAHNGKYQPHIVFGKLTRQDCKHLQLWHCEHHLSFLAPHTDDPHAGEIR